MSVAFHFVLLAIGEVLKVDEYITPQSLQDFIANEDSFGGYRIPLDECRLALQMMENSGFIKKETTEGYVWENHSEKCNDD